MLHIIINHSAASGGSKHSLRTVTNYLQQESVPYLLHQPDSAMALFTLIRQLTDLPENSEEDCHLLVLGGDGTLNLVLQGIRSFRHTKLSCLPCGSGNDFARNRKISKNPRAVIQKLIRDPEETILDYGLLKCPEKEDQPELCRRFLISSGVGFDAAICEEVDRTPLKKVMNRLHLGKLTYTMIGLKQFFTHPCTAATVTMDDHTTLHLPSLFFIVGMIHKYEGGGIPFCPHADPQDRLLDICMVQKMPHLKYILALLMVLCEKHFLFKEITEYRCRKLHVCLATPDWFHFDGETRYKATEFTLECRHGLRLVQ